MSPDCAGREELRSSCDSEYILNRTWSEIVQTNEKGQEYVRNGQTEQGMGALLSRWRSLKLEHGQISCLWTTGGWSELRMLYETVSVRKGHGSMGVLK